MTDLSLRRVEAKALLERVRGARTGWEVDDASVMGVCGFRLGRTRNRYQTEYGTWCCIPSISRDLDSTLWLVGRVLGDDCYVMVERWGSGNSGEALIKYGPNWSRRASGEAPTPALALLCALLSALPETQQVHS